MTDATVPRETTRFILIALIDEPELAMRETMSDEGLDSLTESLRELGQLQPIGVVVAGERFRVAFGHRRRIAAQRAGLVEMECKVFPEGTPLEEAMKVAENDEKEPVNPAGEATYYAHLLETRCGGDVERLAAFVRRPLSRVLDRLDLLRGDDAVLQALREKRITLAVAKELNKVRDDAYRTLFLADAMRDGMNSTAVRNRRQELERTLRFNELAKQQAGAPVEPSSAASIVTIDACAICLLGDDEHEMEYVRVHRSCRAAHSRSMRASAGAPGGHA